MSNVLKPLVQNIKRFVALSLFGLLVSSPAFANAGQEESHNLDVSVTVSPSCTVSTERGAQGMELSGVCPEQVQQNLTRQFVVSPEAGGVSEQLVLVVNF